MADVAIEDYLETGIQWVQKKGFSDIKSTFEGFEKPFSYTNTENNTELIPQITAMKDGRKNYIEVALKSDNIIETTSKWRLLSTLAGMKGGKLYLLTPRGHKSFTDSILQKHPIKAIVVSV